MEWNGMGFRSQKPPKPPYNHRISPTKGFKVHNDPVPAKLNSSSPEVMTNKENITINKLEGPKLSMESMQMKKKKKGRGYNLRKSLAWNKAFFTEEGVLDPIELSMITGTLGNSSREGLSAITEEATTSLSDNQFNIDSANLQTPEKNSLIASPVARAGKDQQTVYLPMKHASPAHIHQPSTSVASHKFLSTHGARKMASRVGSSPRSLPLSPSLKRPGNINAQKAVTKESKLPKLPVSKPGHPSIPAANKRAIHGATSSKQNQMLQLGNQTIVVNTKRNTELKSHLKGVKNTQSKAKAVSEALPNKSSASHAKRNKVNPPVSQHATTPLCPMRVNKFDSSGSKVIPDDVASVMTVVTSDGQDVTTELAVSLPSNNIITGRTLQHTQSQATKPSGLRMPSPSLGFFGESKAPASSCYSRRVVDSNPRLGKLGDWRPPQSPAKIPDVVNGNRQNSNETITPDVGKNAMKEGKKISNESKQYELESDKNTLLSITDSNKKFQNHFKNAIGTTVDEDRGAEMKENKNLLETLSCRGLTEDGNANSCNLDHRASRESAGSDFERSNLLYQQNAEQFAIGVTGIRIMNRNPFEDEKSGNSAVTDHDVPLDSQTGAIMNGGVQNSASVTCMQYLYQPSSLHFDRLETSNGEDLLVSDVHKPSIFNEGTSKKLVGDSQNCGSEKIDNKIFEALEFTYSKLENSEFSSQHIYTSLSEDSFVRNEMTDDSHSLKQSLEVGDMKGTSCMLLPTQTACFEVEKIPNSIHGLPTADCMLLEKDIGSEEFQEGSNEMFPLIISDERDTSEIDNSGVEIAEVFGAMEGEGFDTNQMIRQDFVREPILVSFEVAQPVANQNSSLDTNVSSDVILSDGATSLDMHPYSSEASEFLVGGAHESFHRVKVKNREVNERNLAMVEPACRSLFRGPYPESQLAEVNHTSVLSESKVCQEDQKWDLQNIAETDHTLDGYSGIKIVMQTREAVPEAANVSNISQTGADPEFLDAGSGPAECCGHTSVVCDQSAAGANCTEESEQPELHNYFKSVEEVSEYNNKLLPRNSLYEESAKSEESSVLGSGVDAVPVKCEPCESEFKSSTAVMDAPLSPLPAHVSGNYGGKYNGDLCIEEARSCCMEIEPSSEKCQLSTGSQTRHNVELGGLLVEGDLTLPRSINQSVGLINSALTDETKAEVFQDMDSLVEDTKCALETSLCQEQDENAIAPIGSNKPVTTSNKTNMILSSRNAVPFSDEWLAAIEAAGEEILTMKSGAVQNSPPDKSLPEPSPWSPVKRKNNAIGPYDCTKFTNNLSSDPQ